MEEIDAMLKQGRHIEVVKLLRTIYQDAEQIGRVNARAVDYITRY